MRLITGALISLLLLLAAAPAHAAMVLVMKPGGQVRAATDRFAPAGAQLLPSPHTAPAAPTRRRLRARAALRRRRRTPAVTVLSALGSLARTGAITQAAREQYVAEFRSALRAERRLAGTRRRELAAITVNLHEMAVAGELTPSRLPALFLTLTRNQQWWTSGPLLSYGQRVEFTGSPLLWEYYPGQGLELTVLGNFGKANAACRSGRPGQETCAGLLSELIPLASQRAGGLTWEYFFHFDGGTPPWTSAMSQATALEALALGYRELGDSRLLTVAQEALPALDTLPPAGVAVPTSRGERFVQYSFAPGAGQEVINAFLQTLIGLHTYAQISRNPLAGRLFTQGDAEARAELPAFDTGAWSLYQPGVEDDLSYHELVTGFLQQLCSITSASAYCDTAAGFAQDLKTAPVVELLTHRLTARRAAPVRFTLSKISHVGIVVAAGSRTLFETSAQFPHGVHAFEVPGLPRRGSYTIRIGATDLAGNFAHASFPLTVVAQPVPCGKAKKRCGSTPRARRR